MTNFKVTKVQAKHVWKEISDVDHRVRVPDEKEVLLHWNLGLQVELIKLKAKRLEEEGGNLAEMTKLPDGGMNQPPKRSEI